MEKGTDPGVVVFCLQLIIFNFRERADHSRMMIDLCYTLAT